MVWDDQWGKAFRFMFRKQIKICWTNFVPNCKKQQYKMEKLGSVGILPDWNAISNSSSVKSTADEPG